MAGKQILIKIFGSDPVNNVISSLALQPDLLLPVTSDGESINDLKRRKINYFFHLRKIKTLVMEPLVLKRFLEPEAENALRRTLRSCHQAGNRVLIDITDADPLQAMAVGAVLSDPGNTYIPVVIVRRRAGAIVPQRNSEHLSEIAFPEMTVPEILFLNNLKTPDLNGRIVVRRRDLKRDTLVAIERIFQMKRESRYNWDEYAETIRKDFSVIDAAKRELVFDTESMSIPLSILMEMNGYGIFEEFERKNHIVRILFKNTLIRRLIEHIDRFDTVRVFLIAAQLRNFRGTALCRDLTMVDFETISFIERAMPCLVETVNGIENEDVLFHFREKGRKIFGPTERLILVVPRKKDVPKEIRAAADRLGIELTGAEALASLLEKR